MLACSCGLKSPEKCKALFEAVIAKEFSDYRYARVHRLTVDTYSLQHPDPYMISAKSFAAHLTGLCCAMEFGNDRRLLKALQQWLNGNRELQKPTLLEHVGDLTIAHVENARTGEEHETLVYEWAADVWEAYAVYHDLASQWIEMAKAAGRRLR
ncbi:MAG: DUF5946 family protein [bacterium]